jgi:hypothetical protein
MKTITTDELHLHLDNYLTQAQQEEIVITLDNGKQIRLSHIEDDDFEEGELSDERFENDPRFAQIINARRANYQRQGGIPLAVVQQTLIFNSV